MSYEFNFETYKTFTFADQEYDITLTAKGTCEIENDGIGAYECHGFCGNDRGTDYLVANNWTVAAEVTNEEAVLVDFATLPQEVQDAVTGFINTLDAEIENGEHDDKYPELEGDHSID